MGEKQNIKNFIMKLQRFFNGCRQEIQGLKGQEFDYLNDEYIISNKPYLRLVFGERVGGCIATANKIILSLSSDWL